MKRLSLFINLNLTKINLKEIESVVFKLKKVDI